MESTHPEAVQQGRTHPIMDEISAFLADVYTFEEYRARSIAILSRMGHEVIMEFATSLQAHLQKQAEEQAKSDVLPG